MWDLVVNYFIRISQYPRSVVTIELLLIGLIVYWVVNFIEGTRGERLFRGVIFVLFAGTLTLNLVVRRYQFDRLEFLYKGFLIAILIIAVAAFQPEIRRALIKIGQAKWLGGASQQLSRTVEEIIVAINSLSKSRIGAIIVIEKQVGLREFIETGLRLDSIISADLLKTIFYPGTPLHDMAVVIQGDRIIAARVQLPLAELGAVEDGNLGSRHRAAIGISAGTDATVIVVSEETGIISLAINGTLIRAIPEEQLRNHLTAGLLEKAAVIQTLKDQENQLAETPDEKQNS